jgi:hypothetical protein
MNSSRNIDLQLSSANFNLIIIPPKSIISEVYQQTLNHSDLLSAFWIIEPRIKNMKKNHSALTYSNPVRTIVAIVRDTVCT